MHERKLYLGITPSLFILSSLHHYLMSILFTNMWRKKKKCHFKVHANWRKQCLAIRVSLLILSSINIITISVLEITEQAKIWNYMFLTYSYALTLSDLTRLLPHFILLVVYLLKAKFRRSFRRWTDLENQEKMHLYFSFMFFSLHWFLRWYLIWNSCTVINVH